MEESAVLSTELVVSATEATLRHPAFYAVCLVAFSLGMILAWRLLCRRRRISGQRQEMDREVEERTRKIQNAYTELEKRQVFSKMLSQISTRFITLPPSRISAEIPESLKRVARAINAQRVHIYMPPPESRVDFRDPKFYVEVAYEWHDPSVGPVDPRVQRVYPAMFPWATSFIERGDPNVVVDPTRMPEDALAERKLFATFGWSSMAIIPLFVEKRYVGNLSFTTLGEPLYWLPVLVGELRIVGEIFANALERKRQSEMMTALRQDALDAEERERTRISRELHDQLGGAMTALKIQAKAIHTKLAAENSELTPNAERIAEIIDETLPDVRRICAELRPAMLDELDLPEALEWQAEQFFKNTNIPCEFDLFLEGPLEPQHHRDVALFRVVQELLTNIIRHAQATTVKVSLTKETNGHEIPLIVVSVVDNGVGFDAEEVAQKSDRFGLRGLRERVEHLGGELEISSSPNGGGASITVKVPEHNGHS